MSSIADSSEIGLAMITSKKELGFYIKADRIMNGLAPEPTLKEKVSNLVLATPPVMKYIVAMRKVSYYQHKGGIVNKLKYLWNYHRYNRLSALLGVFVAPDVCGYGLVIPHHGTLRIGGGNKIGNYAVIHTVSNMTASKVVAGDGLYMSVGCKVIGPLTLGNNVSIAANSVVNKSYGDNVLLAGAPAKAVREDYAPWYERDGETFVNRVKRVEALKQQMGL